MKKLLVTIFVLSTLTATTALAEELDEKGIFTINYENDVFSSTDRHYTNGFRASYISSENFADNVIEDIADSLPFYAREGDKRFGIAVGQSMFTPSDITLKNPPQNDRPYAGWLHADFSITSDTGRRLDFLELSLGIVGESALAGEVQDFVHHSITNSEDPQGWDTQIKDEFAYMLSYQRKWKNFWQTRALGLGVDVMPHVGFSAGNVFTQAAAGGTLRIGQDLPSDYGPPIIRPSFGGSDFFEPTEDIGWYLFAGVEGRAVAQNIFLDGSTYRDSRSVEKEDYVADAQLGFAVTYGDTRVSYTHIFKTRDFKAQSSTDSFGSLNLAMRF